MYFSLHYHLDHDGSICPGHKNIDGVFQGIGGWFMSHPITVLYLFESSVPKQVSQQTLGFGELRALATVPEVESVVAIGRAGSTYYDRPNSTTAVEGMDRKISTHQIWGTGSVIGYWLSPLWLFMNGFVFLLQHRVSVIHAESCYLSGLAAIVLGSIFKKPVIIEYHVTYESLLRKRFLWVSLKWKQFVWNKINAWVAHRAAVLCGNCETVANQLLRSFPDSLVSFYNPLVSPPRNHQSTRPVTLCFIGRLYPDKGLMYFLSALNKIKHLLRDAGMRVSIAGEGPDRITGTEYAAKHGLDFITFLGTTDRWEVLRQSDMLINTTVVDAALEMVIVEAAAVGVPTICFGTDMFPETVIDTVTGKKVCPGNVTALGNAISTALSDGATRKRWSMAAKKMFDRRYAGQTQIQHIQSMYQSIGIL